MFEIQLLPVVLPPILTTECIKCAHGMMYLLPTERSGESWDITKLRKSMGSTEKSLTRWIQELSETINFIIYRFPPPHLNIWVKAWC